MVTLNFCTTCGGKKVQDVKQELEKLVTQKDFSSDVCHICCEPIPSGSHPSGTSEEQSLKDHDKSNQDDAIVSVTLSSIKTEPPDTSPDDATDESLHQEDVTMPEDDAHETSDNETLDKLQARPKDGKVTRKDSVKEPNVVSPIDDAQFRLTALRSELAAAIKVVNDGKMPFKCKLCKKAKKFKGINYLVIHLSTHFKNKALAQKPYQCNKCCKTPFKTILEWSQHVNVYFCKSPSCRMRFENKSSYVEHAKNHGEGESKPYQCDRCDRGFMNTNNLAVHYWKFHSAGKIRLPSKKATDVVSDDDEEDAATTEEEKGKSDDEDYTPSLELSKPFKCSRCGKQFVNNHNLGIHQRKFHSFEKVVVKTTDDDVAMTEEDEMEDEKTDDDEDYVPSGDDEIGKGEGEHDDDDDDQDDGVVGGNSASAQRAYMNRVLDDAHFRVMALRPKLAEFVEVVENSRKPFECKFCKPNKRFNGIGYLVFHLSSHLENKNFASKPYQCNKCCKATFKTIRQWSQHVNIHQCRYPGCRKTFKSKAILVAHENTHDKNELKPFKCHVCNNAFLSSTILSCHLRKVHKIAVRGNKKGDAAGEGATDREKVRLFALRPNIAKMAEIDDSDERLPYKCKLCEEKPRQFGAVNLLVNHLGSHASDKEIFEKPYQCNTCCDEQFKNFTQWSDHTRENQCGYELGGIGLRLSTKGSGLERKNPKPNKDNRVKPFTCCECRKSFVSKNTLLKHLRRKHKSGSWEPITKPMKGEDVKAEEVRINISSLKPELRPLVKDEVATPGTYACAKCDAVSYMQLYHLLQHAVEAKHVSKESVDRPYQCSNPTECCDQTFDMLATWKTHVKPYKCTMVQCDFASSHRLKVDKHCRDVHNVMSRHDYKGLKEKKEEDMQFRKMGLKAELRQLLKDDEASAENYTCVKCEEVPFTTITYFISHASVHVSKDVLDEPYQCNECCNQTFRNYTLWKKHVKPLKCAWAGCDHRGYNRAKMDRHFKQKHSNAEREYKCDQCPKAFYTGYHLKTHKKVVHLKVKRFTCAFCGLQFYSHTNLVMHEQLKHTNERPYPCDQCEKAYVTAEKLRIHKMEHTGEKPFICDQCGYAVKTNGELKAHKLTHIEKELRPFRCEICGLTMSTNSWLVRHRRTHTGEKYYKCRYCNECFLYSNTRNNHEKQHPEWTGVRKYECKVCGKDQSSNNKLKRHMMIHTGEKPYQCSQCSFRTNRPESLKTHERGHARNPNLKPRERKPVAAHASREVPQHEGQSFAGRAPVVFKEETAHAAAVIMERPDWVFLSL